MGGFLSTESDLSKYDKVPILEVSEEINLQFKELINEVQQMKENNIPTKGFELKIDNLIFNLYNLTNEERNEIGFIEIV